MKTAQIILSLLLVGVIVFTIVVIFVRPPEEPDEERAPLMLLILGVVAFSVLPVYGIVRKGFIKALSRRHQLALAEVRHHQIPPELMGLAIVGGALTESVGIFGAVVFMLTGEWYALAAPAVAVILLGVQIPGKESLERLIRLARERA